MLCFIYPQMTSTFMRGVVNESLYVTVAILIIFELFLGPQVFS